MVSRYISIQSHRHGHSLHDSLSRCFSLCMFVYESVNQRILLRLSEYALSGCAPTYILNQSLKHLIYWFRYPIERPLCVCDNGCVLSSPAAWAVKAMRDNEDRGQWSPYSPISLQANLIAPIILKNISVRRCWAKFRSI